MNGLMMDYPLTIQHIYQRAITYFGRRDIATLTDEGMHRYTYADFGQRVRQLSAALRTAGVQDGDRIGTFGWNTYRHLELYFAIPCMGAVLHTLNIRLFADQLIYIINNAEDSIIFVDGDLVPLLEGVADQLPTVRRYVIMGPPAPQSQGKLQPAVDYEEFLASAPDDFTWPQLDERQACAMCYTSGTTGNPKGVVYSHRSAYLHTLAITAADAVALSWNDTVLPIVPMFHANAWGLPYAATLVGARQIFPGRFMDPAVIARLIQDERVTCAAGVPTIWINLLQVLSRQSFDLSSLSRILCGGSAVPRSLAEALDKYHLRIVHAWGMTETSPLATLCNLQPEMRDWPYEKQLEQRSRQGIAVPGVDLRIVDPDTNQVLPWDGKSFGEIQVRGPWVASAYYKSPESAPRFADGWFRTGDVATVDEYGYIQIVDRTKDLVKSGGEWISSVELENLIMAHPKVLEAAVIAVPHEKWQERPLACVVPKPEFVGQITEQEILDFLRPQVARWWLPDAVVFIDAIPKTSVGKFDKKVLRQQFTQMPAHATTPTR